MSAVWKFLWIALLTVACLVLLWLFASKGKRKKAGFFGLEKFHYAHRGLHGNGIPENSLAAFSLAVQQGYGAELDVHLSKDGRLVVMHDESLKRTAGVEKCTSDCTSEELNLLHLEDTQERIPYLEEILPLFEGKTPLVIELKPVRGNHAVLAERVCALLERYPRLQFCIESFDPRVLLWLRKHKPNIVRGQLSCNFIRNRNGLNIILAFLLSELSTNFLTQPHFVAYQFEDRERLSLRVSKRLWGVQEFSWTIRSEKDAAAARADDSIIIFEHCRPAEIEE